MMRVLQISLFLVLLGGAANYSMAAPGSWVASAPAVRVAVAGRIYQSQALQSPQPELLKGQRTRSVRWSYRVPAGRVVHAWLCQQQQCMLVAESGQTDSLGDPTMPWYFRFQLPDNERRAVIVEQLQLIVNYQ
ncbi:flagellar protein FlhE [Denitrificimonas sp. JX-1]|uniref:Flagellar protein FlhE n=1 Tax=Denitrificimonas halotolerans TaxID=3098930 RepID=A0ABU5GRP1_9GAMM|nr:flagellar protein FlhE [Denitrificimonas sp. JX-1]MDY7219654.1 flagellar protein FlhE [Denitrificimonas sp. JX-1]